jgi:integrase
MHIPPPGPNRPDSPADPLTVGQAKRLIAEWTDLAPARRHVLVSALSVTERAGVVTLTPGVLRTKMLTESAAHFGVKVSRLRNVISCIRYTLGRAGVIDQAGPPVSASWSALLAPLDPRRRAGLIRLALFCSLRQIAPAQVSAETLKAFEVWLTERTLTINPRKLTGCARTTWNHACRRVSDWPARPLPRVRDEGQFILPLRAFPESFRHDLASLGERMAGTALDDAWLDTPDPTDDDASPVGRFSGPLCTSTVELRKAHCRWAASALVAAGVPIEEVTSLLSLVTPVDRIKLVLRFLYERAGRKPSAAGMHVAEVLRIIAKYHARLPEKDVAQIRRWSVPVKLTYLGMTERNESRVRQTLERSRDAIFLELPDALMRAARRLRPKAPRRACSLAMRAVLIELLSKVPIRLANIVGLQDGQHLQRDDPTRGRITRISIPAAETKNRRAICLPVSDVLARMLQEWIRDFRPMMASSDCTYLFPGQGTGNRPMTPQSLRDAVKGIMKQHIGVPLSPHTFRHLAARSHLEAYPGHYEEVRQLLGHASMATTVRHYSGIESEAAARRFDEIVLNRRKRSRRDKANEMPRHPKGGSRSGGH